MCLCSVQRCWQPIGTRLTAGSAARPQRMQTQLWMRVCPALAPRHGDICLDWKRGWSSWEVHFHKSKVTKSRGKGVFLNVC